MGKLLTYLRYLLDYLKHYNIAPILSSIRYIRTGKSNKNDIIIKTSIGKFKCRKNTNDFQFANFFYEWDVKKFVLGQKNRFSVFIDCGACIGDYCIFMSRYVDRCIAFEPVCHNYQALLENIELNHLAGKIKAFPIALGDENKEISFVFNPTNTGASHKSNDNEASDCMSKQRTLDFLLPELGILSSDHILFKLDCEGMENEAILGARNFIKNHENLTMIIEDNFSSEQSIKKTLSAIASFEFGIINDCNIFARKLGEKSQLT